MPEPYSYRHLTTKGERPPSGPPEGENPAIAQVSPSHSCQIAEYSSSVARRGDLSPCLPVTLCGEEVTDDGPDSP